MLRRVPILLVAFVLFALTPSPVSAQDKKPVRLFAEAEDFTVVAPGWKVMAYRDNYFTGASGVAFLSRMACLSAPDEIEPGQKAVAEQTVTIPYEDTFELLVRYEQPFQFAVEFTVEVEQGGNVVARFPCGRLTDPKIWASTDRKRVAMRRHEGGSPFNIVWQQPGNVKLAAGPAKLRLIAIEQKDGDKPRENIAKRNIDVLCLTNDRVGIEAQKKSRYSLEFDGWLVQDGDVFVRFTNPKDSPQPVVPVVRPFEQGQRSPSSAHVRDWPNTRVLKSGRTVSPTAYLNAGPRSAKVKPESLAPVVEPPKGAIPDTEYLQPGDTSGWAPLGNVLDSLNNSRWFPEALSKGKTDDIYLRLEFGIPDEKGGIKVVKDITVKGPSRDLSPACFDIPGCVNPNPALAATLAKNYWLPQIRTQKEVLDWLNAEVAKFPKVGDAPKRMPMSGIMTFGGAPIPLPEAKQLAVALGDNTTFNPTKKKREFAFQLDPSVEAIKADEKKRKSGFDDLAVVSLSRSTLSPAPALKDAEFAQWLKEKGITVDGEVKYTIGRTEPLFYYSRLAELEKDAARFAAGTAYYKSKDVFTVPDYAPHANLLVTESGTIRPFKSKAFSMPVAADTRLPSAEFSPQVVGYLVSGSRAAANYDDLPIQVSVMPQSPGQLPSEFRLRYYTGIAHGAKRMNYFCAVPSAVGPLHFSVESDDLAMWKQIYTCAREAGIFEDYIMDGKVRPAKVALLLSSTDELITGVTDFSLALHNNERKALYYALRHAQIPVDFLTEDDVIAGRAKDYKLIYLTQQYVHSNCLDALQKWCEAGGTAVAMAGGGFRNEFQKENPAATKFYGTAGMKILADPNLVSKYLTRENIPFLSKHDLPRYEPMDVVQWCLRGLPKKEPDPNPTPEHIFNVPVIAWKQPLTPTDGTVIGKFKDGAPAVVTKTHGKGRAVLFGFLPGQAYLKSGLPVRPVDSGANAESFAHFLPTGMSLTLLARLTDDFLPRDARDIKPVVTTDGLVETTCIDTPAKDGKPAKLAVPLVNWSGGELTSLTIAIRGPETVSRVRSVERGELKWTPVKDGIRINMPLNVADMLLIDR